MTRGDHKPALAVWKLTSCDGCQLSLLDLEDELLGLVEQLRLAYFLEASSRVDSGPYTIALVEGSVTTAEHIEQLKTLRTQTQWLITIGACATAGGIQALRNYADVNEYLRYVYASPEHIHTLSTSTPVSKHVAVDLELHGCPIDKKQLLSVLLAILNGKKPQVPTHSVCLECKRLGHVCVVVAHGAACLGPVTKAGCGALCPGCGRGCYGCFGPNETAAAATLSQHFLATGLADAGGMLRLLRNFNAGASAFAEESLTYERH